MTDKSEWQEANRRLMAEQREKLGEPPTAEEMLAYSRGELSESEEERIRDLLVAYPELARVYGEPFPEEAEPGIADEQIAAGLKDVERRLGTAVPLRAPVRRYLPTTIAAALALLFFGLFVTAESRARNHARGCQIPRVLGEPQALDPGQSRSAGKATPLRRDGEAYLLRPYLSTKVRYPYYSIELHDARGPVWTGHAAAATTDGAFQIVVPHEFLRPGHNYQLRIFGVDGETSRQVGAYDVAVPSE
jgi:hypothetical protein